MERTSIGDEDEDRIVQPDFESMMYALMILLNYRDVAGFMVKVKLLGQYSNRWNDQFEDFTNCNR